MRFYGRFRRFSRESSQICKQGGKGLSPRSVSAILERMEPKEGARVFAVPEGLSPTE